MIKTSFALIFSIILSGTVLAADARTQPAETAQPDGASIRAHLDLASSYRKLGEVDRAEAVYLAILQRQPDCAEAYNGLGFLYEEQGEYPKAIALYQKAHKLKPGWSRPLYHIGSCLMNLHKDGEAERTLKEACRTGDNDASPHNSLGILYGQRSEFDAAEKEYLKATVLRPDWVAPWWNLVLLYDRQGKYDASEKCLDKVLELDPGNQDALYQRVKHLIGKTDYSMAERVARKLVKLHPQSAASHEALGIVLWSREKTDEAEACFNRALKLNPKSAGAYLGLGHVRLARNQFAEAEKNYQKALDINPALTDAQEGVKTARQEQTQVSRRGSGCSMAPGFGSASPLALIQYALIVFPVLLVRRRV